MWPVVVILHITGLETLSGFSWSTLGLLALNGFITVLSNYSWARAIVLTSPLIGVVGKYIIVLEMLVVMAKEMVMIIVLF